jgi:hypothetical protein
MKRLLFILALMAVVSACRHQTTTSSTQPSGNVPAIGAKLALPLPTQTVVPGVYEIQSGIPYNGSQGMCWDLDLNHPSAAVIIQNPCSAHPTQLFRVNDDMDANGYRTISSTFSYPNYQYIFQGNDPGGSGNEVMQATNGSINRDRFRFNDIPNCGGCRYIAIDPSAQFCVDRPTQHMDPGDYIQPFNCNNGQNQIWIMLGPR